MPKVTEEDKNQLKKEEVFFLRLSYSKLIKILEAIKSEDIFVPDNKINYYYTILLRNINLMLDDKLLIDLKNKAPELYENIIGNLRDIDYGWEEMTHPDILAFYGEIETEYINLGSPHYKLTPAMEIFFTETDQAIEDYRLEVKKQLLIINRPKTKNTQYIFNKSGLTGQLTLGNNDSIKFEGRTALILYYFYQLNENQKTDYKTFNDFNTYQKGLTSSRYVTSKVFAQTITEINKTVNKKIEVVQEIISQKEKEGKQNRANLYKWSNKTF